ncbi:glutamic acid-rich protein-like [Branchiostoma lanceolatum]|uniref:glutamic acid-rich protein-like n=1 Tax=Branchiostoma lanceolatum TaxID=7740 RepID=UPI003454826F
MAGELYRAKFDYVKEIETDRPDVLSFHQGDRFIVTQKNDDKWWTAVAAKDKLVGYVPAAYLERDIGKLIPENSNKERARHRSMEELSRIDSHRIPKVGGSPALSRSPGSPGYMTPDEDYDQERRCEQEYDDEGEEHLIAPKKLPNPVKDSRNHQQLHREMTQNKRLGINPLHKKPELQKKWEERNRTKDSEKFREQQETNITLQQEFLMQTQKRRERQEAQSKEETKEDKPEFMRVALKSTGRPVTPEHS